MKSETKKKIREYKKRLPKLKEKVVACALLFAMSAAMLTTVSFAWLVRSVSPEMLGAAISITSNGSLEIALVEGDGSYYPGATQIGDGNLDIIKRNLTWGNLVNLSDDSYGLSNLTLRPAKLNEYGLLSNPLYGPIYDEDGRVLDFNPNFGFSEWNPEMKRFEYTSDYGIRAISSMTYGKSSAATKYNESLDKIIAMNLNVQQSYQKLADNDAYMNALSSIIANYMAYNLIQKGSGVANLLKTPTVTSSNLDNLDKMYEDFATCLEEQAAVFVVFLNFERQLSISENGENGTWDDIDDDITLEELLSLKDNADVGKKTVYSYLTETKGYKATTATTGFIREIDQFLLDYKTIKEDIPKVEEYKAEADANGGKLNWDQDLTNLMTNLVNMDQCEIVDNDGNKYKVGNIGGSIAMNLAGQTVDAYITNGMLKRFDDRSGSRMYAKNVKFSLGTSLGTQTIYGNIQTNATNNYFENEAANMKKFIEQTFGAADLVANDTYGMAIDLWIRTNADNTYLTLQGNVLTRTERVRSQGKDADGEVVDLYTITVVSESESSEETTEGETTSSNEQSSISVTYDVYKKETTDDSGNAVVTWYYASNHTEVEEERLEPAPKEKWEDIEIVIGYEGENRVWDAESNSFLSTKSTTQGNGSCYVFYTKSPSDQAKSLTLLKNMKVAFVDDTGELLAIAEMDTERYYAENGKVMVPLVLDPTYSEFLGNDIQGNPIYAITRLEKNKPLRLTSIVYLDGDGLGNGEVLSTADISGNLNIQFGNTPRPDAMKDSDLEKAIIEATASISKTNFSFDSGSDDLTTRVTMNISADGLNPEKVEAFFVRAINDTQGTREDTFTLNKNESSGAWEYDYEFKYPGKYILRSVIIDGVEYELANDPPEVVVEGFAIQSVSYYMGESIMSDKGSYSGDVSLKFVTDDPSKMPKTVRGAFIRDDGTEASVLFTYNSTTTLWTGTVTFMSSGEYKMQYIVLDDNYVELAETDQYTINLNLGMRVEVSTTLSDWTFGSEEAPEVIPMRVRIVDNNGSYLASLGKVSLNYFKQGAVIGESGWTAILTWNQSLECYEGEFRPEIGIWFFNNVSIKLGSTTNQLNNANADAPVFTIIPPNPPSISSTQPSSDRFQFVKGGNGSTSGAKMEINLSDADAATVVGKMTKESDGTVKYVIGAPVGSNSNTFSFYVPEGEWTLSEIYTWNVYDKNGKVYSLPEGISTPQALVDALNDEATSESTLNTGYYVGEVEGKTVAALYNVTVSFTKYDTLTGENATGYVDKDNKKIVFGKNLSGTVTGSFMQAHTIRKGDIVIEFSDANGLLEIENGFKISDVYLQINHANAKPHTIATYGGYTTETTQNSIVAEGRFSVDKTTATLDEDLSLTYAALYKMGALSYSIKDSSAEAENVTVSDISGADGAYTYEVWSAKPTVAITAISPTGTINVDPDNNVNKHTSTTVPAFTATNATVYFRCSASEAGSGSTCSPVYHNYTRPSVTITLAGIGNASQADLTFGTDVHIYNGTSKTTGYTWTANGTCARNIGYFNSKTMSTDDKTAAGTLTCSTLTLTYSGKTYTVTIPTITISNPY